MRRLLAVLLIALAPGVALAEEARPNYESPRDWMVEVNGGKFRPEIGATGSANPYGEIFGKKSMWLFGGELDYHLFQGFGTLSAGFAADYGVVYGRGIIARTGERSPDTTALKTIPMRALLVYRFDWLSRELGIPLVPFGKAGLAHTLWWVTNGQGDVAKFGSDKAFGGKWGYELAAGLALELNFLDPGVGREFDADFGVNAVYLTAQYMRLTADNFGGKGLNLSDTAWQFGLAFEF